MHVNTHKKNQVKKANKKRLWKIINKQLENVKYENSYKTCQRQRWTTQNALRVRSGWWWWWFECFFFAVRFCATKKGDSAFWSEDAGIFLWANMMKLNNVSAIQRLLDSTVECYRFSNAFEIVIIMWAMWIVRCIFVHSLARFITFNACLYKATKNVSVEIKPFNMCIQYIHGRIRETIRCTTVP